MKKSEIKTGIILSYILLFFNTIYGLLITPYILSYVGEISYGVYKSVSSLSASLAIMDLGLGSTVTRYMAKFHAQDDNKSASNFLAMTFIQYAVLASLILIVGFAIYLCIPNMYAKTFSKMEIDLAKLLVCILLLNMVLRLFENLLFGVANGYEKFTFSNGIKLISVISKFSAILLFLPFVKNILLVVLIETVIVVLSIVVFLFYMIYKMKIRPKLVKWDGIVFRESFGYTLLMFIQTITIQFNGNIDNILIGTSIGSASVTIYSIALTIFGMYENLSGSIANIMLPKITKMVIKEDAKSDIQKTIEKAGRLQFTILAAVLGGFVILGKDFYLLWLGKGFEDCYYLTLILIIPVTFPMVQNVCLSVLRAQNRMVYRTVTLAISCLINVIVTVIGIKMFGYYGAAFGTACATISNLIFMNTYYRIRLGFKPFRMFFNIMGRVLLCMVMASTVTWLLHMKINGTWSSFILNGIVFCVTYGASLIMFALQNDEKNKILKRLNRGAI